ncbi:MAG: HPP family protein [bacterium]
MGIKNYLSNILDPKFGPHWLSYIFQSLLATVAIFVVLITLRQQNLLVAASLAATAFTVFVIPNSMAASSRNVVGGHVVGLIFGSLFALFPQNTDLAMDLMHALAVGSSILVMSVTNTEHPPAAGTALGVVIAGFSYRIVLGVVMGVAILAMIHRLLKPVLIDLIANPFEKK